MQGCDVVLNNKIPHQVPSASKILVYLPVQKLGRNDDELSVLRIRGDALGMRHRLVMLHLKLFGLEPVCVVC